jgi:uncharacterized spore protein YtfJ
MKAVTELIEEATDAIGVRRVFGEPYVKNGVTVIPAARIMGGAGAGEGTGPSPQGEGDGQPTIGGSGGGFGMGGSPAGAYVIRGDRVEWLPAVDVNRMLVGFQVVLVVFLLVVRSIVKSRAETARTIAREEARKPG